MLGRCILSRVTCLNLRKHDFIGKSVSIFSSSLLVSRRVSAKKYSTSPSVKRTEPELATREVSISKPKLSPDPFSNLQSAPFEERFIDWHGDGVPRKLKFRVTYSGIGDYYPEGMMWNISGKNVPAPFYGQEEPLLELLNATYDNWTGGSHKPIFSIQTMGPGSGKTRFLTEWIMHAFANPTVIEKFLNLKYDGEKFLNMLYWSAYKQRTIIFRGDSLQPTSSSWEDLTKAVKKVIWETILKRYSGQQILFGGKEMKISQTEDLNLGGPESEVVNYIKMFVALTDRAYEDPEALPFPKEGLPKKESSLVFFNMDDCQMLCEKAESSSVNSAVLFKLFRSVAASTLRPMKHVHGIAPCWFAVGTDVPGKFYSHYLCSDMFFTPSSLKSLLDLKYLAKISEDFFKMKLPLKYYTSAESIDLPEMPEDVAKVLIGWYLKTCGIPRAVECFVKSALAVLNKKTEKKLHGPMTTLDQIMSQELNQFLPLEVVEGSKDAVELLEIAASLCLAIPSEDTITGLKLSPKQLVKTGYLMVWKRERSAYVADFYYTRPFFMMSNSKLQKELLLLKCKATPSDRWSPVSVSLSSLVVAKEDCTEFDLAVASSLYARYIHTQKEEVTVFELFPAKNMPSDLWKATVKLNGVVKLSRKISKKDTMVLEQIMKNNVIAINKGKSSFADVLLPINIGFRTAILGFQCKQYTSKPLLDELAAYGKEVIGCGFYFVGIASDQHSNDDFQARLAKKSSNKQRGFLAEATEIVSPLYMAGKNFVLQEK